MKTRSEWGSWEDWMEFQPGIVHEERKHPHGGYAVSFGGVTDTHISGTIENARRAAVESYCKRFSKELPWLPDYDLSTVSGCMEVISKSDYVWVEPVFRLEHTKNKDTFKCTVAAALEDWQKLAQYVIDNS